MLAGGADLADGLEDLLQQGELVGGVGIDADELGGVLVAAQVHRVADEGELIVDDVAGLLEGVAQRIVRALALGEQALADDLVGVGAGERQPGVEASLDLGEVLRLGLVGLAERSVDVFLAGDDDPRPTLRRGTKLLGDGLQVEHQLGVVADELTDLVDQEDDAVAGGPGLEVGVHQLGEGLDVDAVLVARAVEPLAGGFLALPERDRERMHDIVAQEVDRIALGLPSGAVALGEGRTEGVIRALLHQVALHVGDVRRIGAEAELLVEHAQEHLEDDVALVLAVGLGVDVEEHHVGTAAHRALDVGEQHRILDLVLVEEGSGAFLLPGGGVGGFEVLEQVGQDLDEVRLARAEEAGHPDAHARSEYRVVRIVGRCQVGIEEATEVFGELLCDDVLVQLLPDALGVLLVGLDHPVYRAVDGLGKKVADLHFLLSVINRKGQSEKLKARGGRRGSSDLPTAC